MDTWKKVLIGIGATILIIFAIVGFVAKIGRPAWVGGDWTTRSVAEAKVEATEEETKTVLPTKEDSSENTTVLVSEKNPILPDMPGTDLHTSWVGDIAFIGWKGQVTFPHPLQDEMLLSEHVFSLHRIDAYDEEMIFVVTWGNDVQNIEGAWFTNEYDVENFDWDVNSPEEFFNRFVEEIVDWTVPNSIQKDSTISVGTTVHISIFFGTDAKSPYHTFSYTK